MINSAGNPQRVVDAVLHGPVLDQLLADIVPDPHDQNRLFRARWRKDRSPCVLKVGLGDLEALWMPAMAGHCNDVVPAILAHGTLDGNDDQQWLIMEDLPYRGQSDVPDTARAVMRTAARFQQEAADLDLPTYPIDAAFIEEFSRSAIDHECPGPVDALLDRVASDDAWLRRNGPYVRCHGDVHFWNAVAASPTGPWRLIDPIPRTAHWAWDAAYAQLTSGTPESPDLIGMLAEERAALGSELQDGATLDHLRTVLLAWSSVMWWPLLPQRRDDPWWLEQVRHHIASLVCLGGE